MRQVIIENPILNSPYTEPTRHFRFSEDGITDEIVESRRVSGYFVPVPRPKKKGAQRSLETEWTEDRFKESEFINRVRSRVQQWRRGGYQGITKSTSRLLEHWQHPDRELKLFICQIEAAETAIYIAEVTKKYSDVRIQNKIQDANHWKDKKAWYDRFFPGRLITTEESGSLRKDANEAIKKNFN